MQKFDMEANKDLIHLWKELEDGYQARYQTKI